MDDVKGLSEWLNALATRLQYDGTGLYGVETIADIRKAAAALTAAEARSKMLEKRSDRYGVALMMINAGCSDPARFAGNILDDKEPIDIDIEDELP